MAFCVKCGKRTPKGAEFCPKCGIEVAISPKHKKSNYSGVGGTLILVGGILSIIFSIFPLAFIFLWGGMMEKWVGMPGMWNKWSMPPTIWGWIIEFMIIGAIISIVLGIVALYAYSRVRSGAVKTGGAIAIVLGIIMLITMNWITGIMTLIGGILCERAEI